MRAINEVFARIGGRRSTSREVARPFVFQHENVLGTSLELRLVAADERCALQAEAAALAEIDRLCLILSGYSGTSEFARWQTTRNEDVEVSPELAEVLESAEAWRIRTNGAFNPGVKAVADLLRGAADFASAGVESSAILSELQVPLWRVDRNASRATRLTALAVSLDAIAKGYIVHRAAARASAVPGVADVLLNIGGDIQHFGDTPVVAGIANPFAPSENVPPIATVRVHNEALATSGGYRRGFSVGGEWHSHIIDPYTRRPANGIVSASVVAPDGGTADALSTAFSVLEPSESVALAESFDGISCLMIDEGGTLHSNAAWRRRAVEIVA